MRNKRTTISRTVFFYLLLHTAIIVLLVLTLMRGVSLQNGPLLMMAVIAGSVALVLYTAYTIVQSITDDVAHREKELSNALVNLQTTLATVREYEKEVGRRAAIMAECSKEIQQRAGLITEYSERINMLVAEAKSASDDGAKPSGEIGRKVG